MATFSVAQLEEITVVQGTTPFRPVRQHFGIMTFGVNTMTSHADGDRLIGEHEEDEPESGEELYVIISGHAWFETNGETQDAPTGTLVHVLPGLKRTAFARTAGTTVLAVGGGPQDQPYQPSGWELFARFSRYLSRANTSLVPSVPRNSLSAIRHTAAFITTPRALRTRLAASTTPSSI